jgi:hypothetical protein
LKDDGVPSKLSTALVSSSHEGVGNVRAAVVLEKLLMDFIQSQAA